MATVKNTFYGYKVSILGDEKFGGQCRCLHDNVNVLNTTVALYTCEQLEWHILSFKKLVLRYDLAPIHEKSFTI